jgi:hypothetical protein
MRFPVINLGPPLTRERLASYAVEYGVIIPEPLQVQLLEQNGGAPENEIYIPVEGQEEELMSFFGIGMNDQATELGWMAKTLEGRLPQGLLAFANDPAGNVFAVENNNGSRSGVWFWNHELEGQSGALSFVSTTFEDFLTLISRPLAN